VGWLEATLRGLVRGLTEVLPVSSSGHLGIAEALLTSREEGVLYEIVVRAGIVLAILLFFRGRALELLRGVLGLQAGAIRYAGKLVVATLPAVLVGLTLKDLFEGLLDRPWLVGSALLATGALLMTTRSTLETARDPEPGWGQALAIGCAQVLAIVPGISRSGVTVATALALGVAPLAATEFSFLLAVCVITVAAVPALPGAVATWPAGMQLLVVGGLAAVASGLAALRLFVTLIRSRRFHQLAYYLWAVGAAFLIWTLATR
jgi:undecaprenyl-diphosphatase